MEILMLVGAKGGLGLELAFRPRELVTVLKGEMNSGENRCRTHEHPATAVIL